jgi:hypothetical protein
MDLITARIDGETYHVKERRYGRDDKNSDNNEPQAATRVGNVFKILQCTAVLLVVVVNFVDTCASATPRRAV